MYNNAWKIRSVSEDYSYMAAGGVPAHVANLSEVPGLAKLAPEVVASADF